MDYQTRKRRARRAAIATKKTEVVRSQAGLRTAQRIAGAALGRLTPSVLKLPSVPLLNAAGRLERSLRRSRIEPKKTLPPKYRSAGPSLRLRAPLAVKGWEVSPVVGEDWSARARDARVERFKQRLSLNTCKERPSDSRKGKGAGGAKPTFIPWCKE